ncbi:hypothetical protein MMC11_005374 [Xylographa trunciseda]|nr:hypothetical protein [Xylographa trunciseda]
MAKPALRLVHHHENADDLLFRGNAELAAGRPDQALRFYTKVLYKVSPGHVCAFLNRSLAYLALGYPELGVMDAYRAAIACHELRREPYPTFQMEAQGVAIETYLRADRRHYLTGEPLAPHSDGHIGPGWLHTELSRIQLAPDIDFKAESDIPWDALEIRAVYRMAGALWHCGLGARSDALGLVEDLLSSAASRKRPYKLTDREEWAFRSLGDAILADCTEDLSTEHELTTTLMKTKTTLVHRVVYPWDTHIPDLNTFKDVEELETYADSAARSCTVRADRPTPELSYTLRLVAARDILFDEVVMSEEGHLQVITAGPSSTEEFFCDNCAAVLIAPGAAQPKTSKEMQHKWASSGASDATTESSSASSYTDSTDDEENTIDPSDSRGGTHYVEHSPPRKKAYVTEDVGSMKESPIASAAKNKAKDKGISFTKAYVTEDDGSREESPAASQAEDKDHYSTTSSRTPTPPQNSKLDMTPDFYHCNVCFAIALCSGDCLGFSGDYHLTVCNTGLEAYIRTTCRDKAAKEKSYDLSSLNDRLYVHPKARCLYDLLFVRIVAMAVDKDVNALDLPEIRWLNGDLRSAPWTYKDTTPLASAEPILYPDETNMELLNKTRRLPWSFTNNVLNPIHYLQTMDIDPLLHLDKTDGWVLNTLFAKIMHCTQITKGVRHAKTYDEIGKFVHEEAPAPKPVDEDVWVGSIHPIFSMVSHADSDKGEKSNVTVKRGKGVKCFAPSDIKTSPETAKEDVGTGAGADRSAKSQGTVCIRAGELIFRPSKLDESRSSSSTGNEGDSLAS